MFPVVLLSSGWRPDERRFITLLLVVACQNFLFMQITKVSAVGAELFFLRKSALSSDGCLHPWLSDSWEDALYRLTNQLVVVRKKPYLYSSYKASGYNWGQWYHFHCNKFSSSSFYLIKISLLGRNSSSSIGFYWCFLHLWRATLEIPYVSSNGFSVLIHTFLFCFSVEEWNSSKADLVKTELALMAGAKCNLIFCLQHLNQELK